MFKDEAEEDKREDFYQVYDAARAEYLLPADMEPRSSGYIPLFCAIFWIATDGGKLSSAHANGDALRLASRKLFSKIASAEIEAIGIGENGLPSTVPPVLFSAPLVEYPFEAPNLDLMMTRDLCLDINTYLGDDSWRHEASDTIRIDRRVLWKQIQVLGRQILNLQDLATITEAKRLKSVRGETKTPIVAAALRKIYGISRPQVIDRKDMLKRLVEELGVKSSPATLGRAIGKAWPLK